MDWKKDKKKSGFRDVGQFGKLCANPEHNPPTHLYIPRGKEYVHYCPSCGKKTIVTGSIITY